MHHHRIPEVPMRPRRLRTLLVMTSIGAITAAAVTFHSGEAQAEPLDPFFPIPPVWCPGGGTQTSWGGYCDGKPFPDGTKWHSDNFVAPFVGSVWNPIVCVVGGVGAPPPLAGPGGCGGAV